MGIGMALFEHTSYDPRTAPINSSLADYIVSVNADVPPLEVHFLEYPDKEVNELGARGIGEIGRLASPPSRRQWITPPACESANYPLRSRTCSLDARQQQFSCVRRSATPKSV